MRLYSLTVFQSAEKAQFSDFFYEKILGLNGKLELGPGATRWCCAPPYLAVITVPDDDPRIGGFSGVQFNVVPAANLNPIVAQVRATGLNQPVPRDLPDGTRVMNIRDPSENRYMVVGTDERPDEPTLEEAIASVSLFVSDMTAARVFFVDGLGLTVRAEPHPGMLVLASEGTAAALLVYKADVDNPNTQIGRETGIALSNAGSLDDLLSKLELHGGTVLDRARQPNGDGRLPAATVADPDGNTFTLLNEAFLPLDFDDSDDVDGDDDESGPNGEDDGWDGSTI